ncbi:MAG TPA: MOSC N-terminal beta barrel domain-containing protein [Alphaproteobacteria bacterium]|nr:MOSC N-terminal beta barrel domain-containing protein [Alphaproteobacteria bacterium]
MATHISGLFRYPVKSLGGEEVERLDIRRSGPVGDRNWAIFNAETNEIRSAKRWPALLNLRARYLEEPKADAFDGAVSPVELKAPDGTRRESAAPDIAEWLSAQLGRAASILPRAPASRKEHYRLARGHRDPAEIAADIELLSDEPLPDFSAPTDAHLAQLQIYATPPGSYVDAYPLHLLSRNSLASLAGQSGLDTNVLRFRPNLVVSVDGGSDWPELDWIGRRLSVGGAVVSVRSGTTRCSMPARSQTMMGVAAEPALTRAIVDRCRRVLGTNLVVEREGIVSLGDPVTLLD